MSKLISFYIVNLYGFFTIYGQSLKGLTWRKYKNSYIMGRRYFFCALPFFFAVLNNSRKYFISVLVWQS
jgi:hypothetical protein